MKDGGCSQLEAEDGEDSSKDHQSSNQEVDNATG